MVVLMTIHPRCRLVTDANKFYDMVPRMVRTAALDKYQLYDTVFKFLDALESVSSQVRSCAVNVDVPLCPCS